MLLNNCRRTLHLSLPKRCLNFFGSLSSIAPANEQFSEHINLKETAAKEDSDEFTKEFLQNRIEVTPFQRIILGAGSSVAALIDPRRFDLASQKTHSLRQTKQFKREFIASGHDMIACLGETTGEYALQQILHTMQASDEGQRILQQKPRINTHTVSLEKLRQLPENTFGRAYVKFLDDNQVTPDSRMEVRFIDDPELAYIMTRYRECHDLVHAILGMPTNMLGEVAVKWVEALNNGLPMCYGGAVFGAFRLRPKQRKQYLAKYLPWAIQNGKNAKSLMAVFWEERWEQNIDEMRNELQITTLKI